MASNSSSDTGLNSNDPGNSNSEIAQDHQIKNASGGIFTGLAVVGAAAQLCVDSLDRNATTSTNLAKLKAAQLLKENRQAKEKRSSAYQQIADEGIDPDKLSRLIDQQYNVDTSN